MTPTANLASTDVDAHHSAAPAADAGSFVLNLCSSTTPMALAQTELPELKRFTFFVSRRFEEGRERFRLHMGFFASQAEAEEWLSVVRDIYPGAWAGEAPGKKLRARAAEAAAAQAGHAVGPQKTVARPAAPAPTPAPPAARPQSSKPAVAPPRVPTLVPTLHPPAAAPASARASAIPAAAARAPAAQSAKAAPQLPPKRPVTAASAPRPTSSAAARAPAQSSPPSRPAVAIRPAAAAPRLPQQPRTGTAPAGAPRPAARPAAVKPAAPAAAVATAAPARPIAKPSAPKPMPQSASRAAQPTANKPLLADSNVKEVMAALDRNGNATGETRLMPSLIAQVDATDDSSLTDTQVLRFLETRREADDSAQVQAGLQVDAAAESGISLLKPDDTGTRRALKEAVSQNEPVAFAVQLQWSVQPVELDKVPPLAIFSAYTLYSVEGSREGRRWYGLRLGFFNDAISAKQVAYYVRSEFTAVAVVPVSPQERDRATEDHQRFAGSGAPRKRRDSEDGEFKLIDSDEAPAASAPAAAQPAPVAAKPAQVAAKPAPAAQPAAARSDRKSPGTVNARERRTPQTLEETLEILGANELAIDNGSREALSDTGVRHLRIEVQKNTPFSRLLERLSERVRKA
ncbi:MAG: hypothetical protein ACREVO_19530 [Steroidobacteraceae bacterium]